MAHRSNFYSHEEGADQRPSRRSTRHRRRHDVYDDTVGPPAVQERHQVPATRHHEQSRMPYHGEVGPLMDPFQSMERHMRAFDEGMNSAFGGWGLGSFLGGDQRSMFGSFDRMFNEAANTFGNVAGGHGGGTYYYESSTRTVGPDGHVREEHVRTTPDENGRPQTRRVVRDGDETREMNGYGGAEYGFGGMLGGARPEPEVIVEEADDEHEGGYQEDHSHGRRRNDEVIVQEIEDDANQPSASNWVKEKYRHWTARR